MSNDYKIAINEGSNMIRIEVLFSNEWSKFFKFFGFAEEDEDTEKVSTSVIHSTSLKKPAIHSIQATNQHPYEIRISFPKEYEDLLNIASHLQNNRAVLQTLAT